MSTPTTGQCCVCGQATKTRCGACEAAGFDLFFCSREHQKLIWPVHKRVCGERSKPFLWPELTREESDDAWANLHTVTNVGTKFKTMADILSALGVAPSSFFTSIVTLEKGAPDPPSVRSVKQSLLLDVFVRAAARQNCSNTPYTPSPDKINSTQIFDQLVTASAKYFPRVGDQPYPPWWSTLHHKLLISLTLFDRSRASPQDQHLQRFAASAESELVKWLNTEVAADDPKRVQRFYQGTPKTYAESVAEAQQMKAGGTAS